MSDSWRFISTIAKKEIVEFVRDWRTLIALIVIPLLIFPALFIALPLLLQSEAAELDAMELEVVWQGDVNDELNTSFAESNLIISYEEMPSEINNLSDIGNDLDRIRNQETQAVFRLLENESGWKFLYCIFQLAKHLVKPEVGLLMQLSTGNLTWSMAHWSKLD